MDRMTRRLAGFGLALLATAGGCRATRDEVPPGRAFRNDGRKAEQAAEFSSQPHPSTPGSVGSQITGMPGNRASGPITLPPPGDAFGAPPGGKFGAPGSNGLGTPPSLDPAASTASAPAPAATYPPQPPAGRGQMTAPESGAPPY